MSATEQISIALPADIATIIQDAVDAGEYASQSHVVNDALRDWTDKRKRRERSLSSLRDAWYEAVTDDSEGEDPAPILDSLERKYDALAQPIER